MSPDRLLTVIVVRAFAFMLLVAITPVAALADNGTGGSTGGSSAAPGGTGTIPSPDSNPGTAWDIRKNYFKRFKWAQEFANADVIQDGSSQGPGTVTPDGPAFSWPKVQAAEPSQVPTMRDSAIGKYQVKTYGYPVSDTQFQIIQRMNDNMMLEQMFDPERKMWQENAMGAIKATSAANSAANLGRNQAAGAIGFVQNSLVNFTAEPDNEFQRLRNNLFVPMAVLLLLPGAVLSQVRAIVAQGFSVLGDVNPFDGILRAIVAIFLIPATLLVVNYGIDVSNAIQKTISDGYAQVVGGNMYTDATCAQNRAMPIRDPNSNTNGIPTQSSSTTQPGNPGAGSGTGSPFQIPGGGGGGGGGGGPSGGVKVSVKGGRGGVQVGVQFGPGGGGISVGSGKDQFSGQEAISFDVGASGNCNGGTQPEQSQSAPGGGTSGDESDSVLKSTQRLAINGANAGMTAMWNVLCAFQTAYLYYLFCMGPVVAALWVWPTQQLRGALPSWAEGVITLCFWMLFWNTTVLLMALFKNVGDTGTIIMTALNFLANNCVKYAFDFAGLIKAAGEEAGKKAKGGGGGGGGKGGGKGGDASKGAQAPGATAPGAQPGTTPGAAPGGDTGTGAQPGSPGTMPTSVPVGGSGPGHGGPGSHAGKGLHAGHTLPHSDRSGSGGDAGHPGSGPPGSADAAHPSLPTSGSEVAHAAPPMSGDHSGGRSEGAGIVPHAFAPTAHGGGPGSGHAGPAGAAGDPGQHGPPSSHAGDAGQPVVAAPGLEGGGKEPGGSGPADGAPNTFMAGVIPSTDGSVTSAAFVPGGPPLGSPGGDAQGMPLGTPANVDPNAANPQIGAFTPGVDPNATVGLPPGANQSVDPNAGGPPPVVPGGVTAAGDPGFGQVQGSFVPGAFTPAVDPGAANTFVPGTVTPPGTDPGVTNPVTPGGVTPPAVDPGAVSGFSPGGVTVPGADPGVANAFTPAAVTPPPDAPAPAAPPVPDPGAGVYIAPVVAGPAPEAPAASPAPAPAPETYYTYGAAETYSASHYDSAPAQHYDSAPAQHYEPAPAPVVTPVPVHDSWSGGPSTLSAALGKAGTSKVGGGGSSSTPGGPSSKEGSLMDQMNKSGQVKKKKNTFSRVIQKPDLEAIRRKMEEQQHKQ